MKSKFSKWANFPQHKLCLGEICPHHMREICPFCLPLLLGLMMLGLTVTWRRRNKLINSDIQRGSWKFDGHLKWHLKSQLSTPFRSKPQSSVCEPVFPLCRPESFGFSLVAAAFWIPTAHVAVERRSNVVLNTHERLQISLPTRFCSLLY